MWSTTSLNSSSQQTDTLSRKKCSPITIELDAPTGNAAFSLAALSWIVMHNPELAALDRKITAELAPRYDENDGTENKQEQSQQYQSEVKAETTVTTVNVHTTDTPQGHRPSMVAEPRPRYPMTASTPRFPARHSIIWLLISGTVSWRISTILQKI